MKLSIDFRKIPDDGNTIAYVDKKLSFALARVKHEIEAAVITLSDINGPKGGVDKQCKIVIHANGLQDIVISERQPDLYDAINRCIVRASQNLARQLKRKKLPKYRKLTSQYISQQAEEGGRL